MRPRSPLAAGASLAAALLVLSGCTGQPPAPPTPVPQAPAPAVPADPALRLVAYSSCADALDKLRAAAKQHVGPYGLVTVTAIPQGAARAPGPAMRAGDGVASADGAEAAGGPAHSGTNTHEAGVDEPDLVKTDGERIVTLTDGVLRVVDAATRRPVGSLRIADRQHESGWDAELLLHGDRALVLVNSMDHEYWQMPAVAEAAPDGTAAPDEPRGPRILLVDVAGPPRLLAAYRTDGRLVDARQVGGVARLVVRSAPRIAFPAGAGSERQRIAANRRIIDRADVADWLPRYEVTENGRTTAGRVDCDRITHPDLYSGATMLTLLTFDLGGAALGSGEPVTVVADGDTVYSNGPSLYVAADQRWRWHQRQERVAPATGTRIYKFDTAGREPPRYVAGGAVPGWLLNQYSMSEWDGRLRVATTTSGRRARSESAVHVLDQRGSSLAVTGKVGGLGKGEQIYAVRFIGPVGYVVTFRQTDPLYVIDLREPARPRVSGELKITGYSAYLHPAGDGRLLGVGQEADRRGRVQGLQVSLFDVSEPGDPRRVAQHHLRDGFSEVEYEPHAFLYWPADRLLVLPVGSAGRDYKAAAEALVLRVGDGGLTRVGAVDHPPAAATGGDGSIRRSLVVDGVLWTVSNAGLKAVSLSNLETLAWIGT